MALHLSVNLPEFGLRSCEYLGIPSLVGLDRMIPHYLGNSFGIVVYVSENNSGNFAHFYSFYRFGALIWKDGVEKLVHLSVTSAYVVAFLLLPLTLSGSPGTALCNYPVR